MLKGVLRENTFLVQVFASKEKVFYNVFFKQISISYYKRDSQEKKGLLNNCLEQEYFFLFFKSKHQNKNVDG